MDSPRIFLFPLIILVILSLFVGCTPSSYSIRYKNNTGLKSFEDSLKVGLVTDTTESMLYYSQIQDTSSEFQDWEEDEELASDDNPKINIASILEQIKSSIHHKDTGVYNTSLKEKMLIEIIKYIDAPYKYGGNSADGIDCSALTQNVFSSSLGINLFRSAREQFTQGVVIRDKEDLVFGDLVFFNTRRRVRPGHVGIYIGDNLFAHASSSNGVIVSSLDHKYYSKRYMGARRINDSFTKN
jgi:cell wall-associated NlpC family hydrolase